MKQLVQLEYLAHQGLPIYPQTLETYNAHVHYFERGLKEKGKKELLEIVVKSRG